MTLEKTYDPHQIEPRRATAFPPDDCPKRPKADSRHSFPANRESVGSPRLSRRRRAKPRFSCSDGLLQSAVAPRAGAASGRAYRQEHVPSAAGVHEDRLQCPARGAFAFVVVLSRGRLRETMHNAAWIVHDLTGLRAPHRRSAELDVTTSKGMRLPHGAMILVGVFAFLLMIRFGVSG
jgi:hypothetical protein